MSCRRYERLLYLFREGELGPADRSLVEKHLRSCPRCSEEYRQIVNDSTMLEGVRRTPLRLRDSDALTRRILEALPGVARVPAGPISRLLDGVTDWVELPPVRYASVVVVAGATCLFLFQQTVLFLSLQDLENRMAVRTRQVPSPAVEFRMSKDDALQLAEAGVPVTALREFVKPDGTVSVSPGQQVWTESALEQLAVLQSLEGSRTRISDLPSAVTGILNRTYARMTLLQQGG